VTPDWLAGPGTFWILGASGTGFAALYVWLALHLGKQARSESDGCLLAICNLVLVVVGGAVGYLLLRYPYQLLSAMGGSVILPGLMTLIWVWRLEKEA
jgi:hypothetical protein